MNSQELQNDHSISVDSRLAMLRLCSAAETTAGELSGDHQQCHSCGGSVEKTPHSSPEIPTTAAAAVAAVVTAEMPPEKNTLYGGATTKAKRYSNCGFSSSLEEPFPKRTATLYGGGATTTTTNVSGKNNHRELPPLISTTPTAGDTYNKSNSNNNSFQGFIKIPLQESPVTTPSPSPSPAKPPLPPPLYRTFSDPTGSISYTRKLPTPPSQRTLARTASWSPNVQDLSGSVNNGESPTAMRLKRMKDGMREMRQWCDLMIQEEETEPERNKIIKDDETETDTGGEALCEEAVWVERMGSCLILHFKCPCGKGYQILLCGNNCYYKLTNF